MRNNCDNSIVLNEQTANQEKTQTTGKSIDASNSGGEKETLSEREQVKQKRMDMFVQGLSRVPGSATSISLILKIILPFLKIGLSEPLYCYLLGLISFFTLLTNKQVAQIAGCSPTTVQKGRTKVIQQIPIDIRRQRRKGGGRKRVVNTHPEFESHIIQYVRLRSYGPCTKDIAEYTAATLEGIQQYIRQKTGITLSKSTIRRILQSKNIRLRTNKKLLYGNQHSETEQQRVMRHKQFDLIFETLEKTQNSDDIVLSIDCKKKENLGPYACSGKSYSFGDDEVKAYEHDFFTPLIIKTLKDMDDLLDRQEGKGIPYGILDINDNHGYVNIGITHDTPEFVIASLLKFMPQLRLAHPKAKRIYLFCDGGGSNSSRGNQFKYYLTWLSWRIGLPIVVIHYPPYRSKFNKIEHQLFAFLSKRYESTMLYNLRTLMELTKSTTTKKGLKVDCEVDIDVYETQKKLSKEQEALIRVEYFGPTKDASSKLSYIIDGVGMNGEAFPEFVRRNIFEERDRLLHEDEEKAKKKAETKANTQSTSKKKPKKRKSRNRSTTAEAVPA